MFLASSLGTVENHGKNGKNTAHFCENRGNKSSVYIAANLLKLMVSNSRKIPYIF